MKRKAWRISIFVMLILVVLGSCKAGMLGTPVLGNKPKVLKPNEIPIRVIIDSDNFPSYRTINPNDWTDSTKGDLIYIITGTKDAAGGTTTPISGTYEYTWEELKKEGTASIILEKGSYNLTMTAVKEITSGGSTTRKKVLVSQESKVTIGTTSYIDFVMKPCRSTQAIAEDAVPCAIDISVIHQNPVIYSGASIITDCKLTLTPISIDGDTIGTVITDLEKTSKSSQGENENLVEIWSFSKTDVVPGVYNLDAKLTTAEDTFVFTEVIIVDPGNTSVGCIECPIDFKTPPKAPANFKMEYIRPGDIDGNYSVKFTWEDRSINEDGFVLQILDITDPSSPAEYKTYDISKIAKNVEEFTIPDADKLTLGTKYKAKIFAKNMYGSSDVVEYKKPMNDDTIHLHRIKYNLDGGQFIAHPDNTLLGIVPTPATNPVIAYYTCSSIEVPLAGNAKLPMVFKLTEKDTAGGTQQVPVKFEGWTVAGSADVIIVIPANVTGEYELTAKWGEAAAVGLTFPSYNNSAYIKGSNNYIDYTIGEAKNIVVNVLTSDKIISSIEPKWYLDGVDVTSSFTAGISTDTTARTATLPFNSASLAAGVKFESSKLHQVLCIITLKTKAKDAADPEKISVVSASCYLKPKE